MLGVMEITFMKTWYSEKTSLSYDLCDLLTPSIKSKGSFHYCVYKCAILPQSGKFVINEKLLHMSVVVAS